MGFLELYGIAALAVYGTVSVLWAVSVAVRDASIIDVFWGTLFVAIAWTLLVTADAPAAKTQALVFMVTAWGLRLSFHLGARNIGHGEDSRYALWRQHGGPHWWLKTYYRIYLLQGTIALLVATPLVAGFLRPHDFSFLNLVGVVVWIVGLATEITADVQLTRFRARPDSRGEVLDTGLWRYSRHPNYFGDALQWWGLGLFTFAGSTPWSVVGPVVMTLVFLYLSNDVIERGLKKRRPGYERYIAATSAFFPRKPVQPTAARGDEDGRGAS
jgi:steroid 5-alpha reductase family enzyme